MNPYRILVFVWVSAIGNAFFHQLSVAASRSSIQFFSSCRLFNSESKQKSNQNIHLLHPLTIYSTTLFLHMCAKRKDHVRADSRKSKLRDKEQTLTASWGFITRAASAIWWAHAGNDCNSIGQRNLQSFRLCAYWVSTCGVAQSQPKHGQVRAKATC